MIGNSKHSQNGGEARQSADGALEWGLSRRSLLGAGALLGLAALTFPNERALAWSSWTNATSSTLKDMGMGDCVHEDLVQISYARMLRSHANDAEKPESLLNPWAGTIQGDARYASIAGDVVDKGKGETFGSAEDLAKRLFRENLAYLRIGSFWNDAAANTLADFGYSCYYANSIPKFSGSNYYEGAWDVGQHIWETNEKNKSYYIGGLDALVQFTMNDRNNFIHGMLSSTADHSGHLRQSEVKKFAMQWLGVAYEYARTGEITATNDVTKEQAEKIFKGFIDTYGQLDEDAHDMHLSLQVGSSEASIKLPRRRLRLRAIGMMCHTMEDFWCPAHTCRTYRADGAISKNSILAFSNYKLQNGNMPPMCGYHIPFDRYAISDAKNSVNWREALTRGAGAYKGTETLANVLDDGMSCLDDAHTYFNTLGMNETIACITRLLEYLYQGTAWDGGVRDWIDTEILPTYFNKSGQSYVCDAGRRSLHTPTYIIAPIHSLKWAYRQAGLSKNRKEMLKAASSYNAWQKGSHLFYSGKYNTTGSKYVTPGHEGDSIWDDNEGENRLVELVDKIHEGYSSLDSHEQSALLDKVGCNGCHDMLSALGTIAGMLQEFSIELRGSLRPDADETMTKLKKAQSFFESGLKATMKTPSASPLLAAGVAFADEEDDNYSTSSMALEDCIGLDDGSYLIAVRDMDSLETSVMIVPENTPGKDKLNEGLVNLTIAYALRTEFDDDLDYEYIVSEIDYSDMEENVYLVTGTVTSISTAEKEIVLDLNGISELTLTIRDGISDVPEMGAYICARYAIGDAALEFVDYDELDAPGKLKKVTYPVAKVAGTSVWLLTNGGDSDASDGYRDFLQIDYGAADVRSVPQEGYEATVYYHDEVYGDTADVNGSALTSAAMTAGSTSLSAQGDGDLNDSVTPGYLELGDEYGTLNYGNEVLHVAHVIFGLNEEYLSNPTGLDGIDLPSRKTPTTPDSQNRKTAKTGGAGSTTPKTGDPLTGFNGVLSVAAAASAAMVAYSARRVANENRKSDEG